MDTHSKLTDVFRVVLFNIMFNMDSEIKMAKVILISILHRHIWRVLLDMRSAVTNRLGEH